MIVASFWPKMLGEAVTAALKYSNYHCNFWPERLGKAVTEALNYSNDRCSFWPQRLGEAVTEVIKHSLTLLAKEARKAVSDIHIFRPHWNFWLEAGRR